MKIIKEQIKRAEDLTSGDFDFIPAWVWDEDIGTDDNYELTRPVNPKDYPKILEMGGVYCKAHFTTKSGKECNGFIRLDFGKCHHAILELEENNILCISQMPLFWRGDSKHKKYIEVRFGQKLDDIFPVRVRVYVPDADAYELQIFNLSNGS